MVLTEQSPKKIYYWEPIIVSDMQWPCPDGFHVPLKDEWVALCGILTNTFGLSKNYTTMGTYLKMPAAWYRDYNATSTTGYNYGYYWSSMADTNYNNSAYELQFTPTNIYPNNSNFRTDWNSIRCLKNSPEIPTSSWTTLYQGTWSAWIFWNSTDWLISVSGNGTTWYTIQDKNLGATQVYNYGDTMSEANCWKYYQRGNDYWFPRTWTVTTSSTRVNASSYWPWNYYNSSTFITWTSWWDSSTNNNLWWWVTQWTTETWAVKAVYLWENKVRPTIPKESIIYKMIATNGYLRVPTTWVTVSWGYWVPYSWKVSVDGWAETTYTGSSANNWNILLEWYTAWEEHTIMITPTTEDYWWARAYSWGSVSYGRNDVTEIVYDWSYMWYAVSATDTWNYFRYNQYYNCQNLIKAPEEYLPDTVTTIWNFFRYYQFTNALKLPTAPAEVLPSSVTSIWTNFRWYQYNNCQLLSEIKWWKDSSVQGTANYRVYQFRYCVTNKTVKVLSDVWAASSDANTLENSYVTQVKVPSAYLNNFKNATVQPRSSITDSKFVWY